MSLINDALKQAGQAQKDNPPPDSKLEFRAAEQSQRSKSMLPVIIVALLVLVLGAAMVVFALRKDSGESQIVKATEPKTAAVASTATTVKTPAAPTPSPARALETAPPSPVVTPTAPAAPAAPPTESSAASTSTNGSAAATPAEAPKPAAPKLQGLYYNPSQPSAVVNGRTVYVGDRVGEFRVREITKDSVTLASASEIHVLHLSD